MEGLPIRDVCGEAEKEEEKLQKCIYYQKIKGMLIKMHNMSSGVLCMHIASKLQVVKN